MALFLTLLLLCQSELFTCVCWEYCCYLVPQLLHDHGLHLLLGVAKVDGHFFPSKPVHGHLDAHVVAVFVLLL